MPETDDQLARHLLKKVLDFDEPWTPDMRLRIATVSQAYASLAIVDELRRLNTRNDRFDTALMEFFERLTEDPQPGPDGSLRSEQPAAASAKCRVCGRPEGCDYPQSGLTVHEWAKHWDANFHESMSFNASTNGATEYANRETTKRFGPCPEES